MRNLYLLLLAALSVGVLSAQTTTVNPNLDGTADFPFTYINVFIQGDTASNGDQNNDVYLLEAGGLYFFNGTATWDFDVTLRATGDVEALGRPFVSRFNPDRANLPGMYRGFGSVTMDGLYVVLGEEGPNASAYETASFRPSGDFKRYVVENCIIEKSRQGLMRIDGEGGVAIVRNNLFRNFGDYGRIQGNGRIVDPRTSFMDSVVIEGNYIHNILDRMFIGFRHPGVGHFSFSGNTVFNHVGRHGFVQLKSANSIKMNDNLLKNVQILGAGMKDSLANEQLGDELFDQIYVFSMDSIPTGATIDMRNNAIDWDSEVTSNWASNDSLDRPNLLDPTLVSLLGADTANAFIRGDFSLRNVPSVEPLVRYTNEIFTSPDSTVDIMVEDTDYIMANPEYDNGNNFDFGYNGFGFDNFNACLESGNSLRNASTMGGGVGATWLCSYTSSDIVDVNYNSNLALTVAPSLASETTTLSFKTEEAGEAELIIYDNQGRAVRTVQRGYLAEGEHRFELILDNDIPTGIYFVNLRTSTGRMFKRLVVQK